jgi:hypothetical protein
MSTPWRCLAVSAFAATSACTDSSSSDAAPVRSDFVCMYETAKCFPDICAGCTVGGDGACPPKDSAYSEICSEDPTERNCRDRAVGPEQVSQSSSQQRYTRNVRILRGISACAQFRSSGEAAATEVEDVCSGVCE